MKNRLSDLRNHLFETIEALKDEERPMDIERAKAVCGVADKIIDTGKLELKAIEICGERDSSRFFDAPAQPALPGEAPSAGYLPNPR